MRKWRLPGTQELTKDQETALEYSELHGQHLVIGGPGTGKTVVIVMRAIQLQNALEEKNRISVAMRLRNQGPDYVFLVYNHMLHQASRQLTDVQFVSSTWMSWFYSEFRILTGKSVRNLAPYSPDWKVCLDAAKELSHHVQVDKNKFLLIDEGQDMPPEFYQTLIKFGYENFFVAADQNQQIHKERNSSRMDIELALGLDTKDVIELKQNFRNNYPVARLARCFYTGDKASPPPDLPESKGELDVPRLYIFRDCPKIYERISRGIIKFFQEDKRMLIGVFAPNKEVKNRYLAVLKKAVEMLIGNSSQVYTYESGEDPKKVRFDQGGVVVINAQSCKGLEFDIVVIADINEYYVLRENTDEIRKLFYVMVSRAREKVFLLMKDGPNLIQEILPKDKKLLIWDTKTFGCC